MARELAALRPRLAAGDVGRGGDGRELDPRDNGGPEIIDTPVISNNKNYFFPLLAVGVLSATFYINRDLILEALKERGFTPDQLLEKLSQILNQ